MTIGQIAALIAAIAFVILVIYLVIMLFQLAKVFKNLRATVLETTKAVKTLTIDLDKIANQGNNLTGKINDLMDDVNQKSGKLNPFFQSLENFGNSLTRFSNKSNDSQYKKGWKILSPWMAQKVAKGAWKVLRKKK